MAVAGESVPEGPCRAPGECRDLHPVRRRGAGVRRARERAACCCCCRWPAARARRRTRWRRTPPPAVCRIGPDGGRPVADRGIGGTGAPPVQVADRGIGGTGIIGVITGFASVCVAGEEVALPPGVLRPDRRGPGGAGRPARRAGGGARWRPGRPGRVAGPRIAVRHVVVGPVDAVGPGTMTVAGQMVAVAGSTGGAVAATPGQWVAVSGLPQGAAAPSPPRASTRRRPGPCWCAAS